MSSDNSDDDYEVGYGKPPKHGQFKKGQSGNPKGRPKGALSTRQILAREGRESITIKENGSSKTITKQEGLVKAMYSKGMQGDVRAATLLLNFDCDVSDAGSAASNYQPGELDLEVVKSAAGLMEIVEEAERNSKEGSEDECEPE